ncbi:hypothetical protein [Spirosoma areae]
MPPLHPFLVGLQSLLRDVHLVSGSPPTRSEHNVQSDFFTPSGEAQQRTNPLLSGRKNRGVACVVRNPAPPVKDRQLRRLACRPKGRKLTFQLAQPGRSRCRKRPGDGDPKAHLSGRATCRRSDRIHAFFILVLCTQRPKGLMVCELAH